MTSIAVSSMLCSRGESLTARIKHMINSVSKAVVVGFLAFTASACSTQSVSSVDLTKYCKQLVGDAMGRDPSIMLTDQATTENVSISYIREDDSKEFKYQCKEEGGNIIWRGVDIFRPGDGPGRWRNEDARPISTFQ